MKEFNNIFRLHLTKNLISIRHGACQIPASKRARSGVAGGCTPETYPEEPPHHFHFEREGRGKIQKPTDQEIINQMIPQYSTIVKRYIGVIVLLCGFHSPATARVGETESEVEARYGTAIAKDHPMLRQKEISTLLKMPTDSGVVAAYDFKLAMAELMNSPYRDQAYAMLDNRPLNAPKNLDSNIVAKVRADFKRMAGSFVPKIYLYQNILIQVVFVNLKSGFYSISEQYFDLTQNVNISSNQITDDDVPLYNTSEWFKLGKFSYNINSAKITKHAVSANDLENQISSAVMDLAIGDLKSQAKKANVDLGLSDTEERFVIVNYDIRNEDQSPSIVLTDDFRLRDSQGREFTPDGEITAMLIETSDKAVLAEVLQPGIERRCYQGFRIPANALNGQLTLIVPEKGVLAVNEGRVIINESPNTGEYSIKPIASDLLRSIVQKTLERSELPDGLKPTVTEAKKGYYDFINRKWHVQFDSKMALDIDDRETRSRIFLDFTGGTMRASEDKSGWMIDPLYQRQEFGPLMTVYDAAKKIRDALKKAEEQSVRLEKTGNGF